MECQDRKTVHPKTLLSDGYATNFRGYDLYALITEYQNAKWRIEDISQSPELYFPGWANGGFSLQEYTDCKIAYNDGMMKAIEMEWERRERYAKLPPDRTSNSDLIKIIKERVRIEDVLEWYGDVTFCNNGWQFRCTKHTNEDSKPSGKIYLDQNTYHCFGCNQGGDVLDAVQHYEGLTLPAAIKKLANWLGLETSPLPSGSKDVF